MSAPIVTPRLGGTGLNTRTIGNGKLLIGNGTGYSLNNLTAGDGISIINAAGTITIAAETPGTTLTSETGLVEDFAGVITDTEAGASRFRVTSHRGSILRAPAHDPGHPSPLALTGNHPGSLIGLHQTALRQDSGTIHLEWLVNLDKAQAPERLLIGLLGSMSPVPVQGIWLEYQPALGNTWLLGRGTGLATLSRTGYPVISGWHRVIMTGTNGSWEIRLNELSLGVITSDLPAAELPLIPALALMGFGSVLVDACVIRQQLNAPRF